MNNSLLRWDDLKKYHLNPPYHPIPRHPEVQRLYDLYNLYNLKANLKFLIKNNNIGNDSYIITYNNFPYYLEPDITHLVIWILPPSEGGEISYNTSTFSFKDLEDILHQNNIKEYIYFINYPENKSIKDIEHIHLFLRFPEDVKKIIS